MSCPWESSRCPHSSNPIFIQLVSSSTNPIQTANNHHNNTHNDDKFEADETGATEVWHQVKNHAVGLEFIEQMCFGTVLQKKPNKVGELEISAKTVLLTMSGSLALTCPPPHTQVSHFYFR